MKATAASAARGAGGHYREKQVLVRVIWTVLIGAFALAALLAAVVGTAVAGYALFVLFGMDRAHTFFDSENRAASAARQ